MNGAHAGDDRAIDVAFLVVDENAGTGGQAKRFGD
jgi:hypothetical protein